MHKKFEINQTKIMGGCQSGRKVVTQNSKNDLPLVLFLCPFANIEKLVKSSSVSYYGASWLVVVEEMYVPCELINHWMSTSVGK